MILELMEQNFLAGSAAEMARTIQQFVAASRRGDPAFRQMLEADQLVPADVELALSRVREVAAALAAPSNPEAAYMPRDARTAQVQSVLQRYALTHGLTQTATAQGAAGFVHPVSDVSLIDGRVDGSTRRLFGAMSQSDIGWISCWAAKAFTSLAKTRAFPKAPAPPFKMTSDARLYLVGDWGSGVARARKIADRVRSMLADEKPAREQHVLHLGDVYYSGWPEEYDDHFLQFWPVAAGHEQRVGSWSLNSNHDMFSKASGYFDHLLKDSRFKAQGDSSYFSLENDHWQVLGLDSAFEDATLAGDQFDWVEERHRAQPSKKLMLLTHHQPFSAFEGDCVELYRLMARNTVTAWFWGHEHRFAMYKPRPDLKYGRLVGHGGVPVWARQAGDPTPDSVAYVSDRGFRSGLERFALFGFAVLDFDGPRIKVRYIDEHGDEEQAEVME